MMLQNRLYELRKQAGLSQEALAQVVGVSRQAVQKWESGASRPDIENLLVIADYFGVTLDDLVRGPQAAPHAPDHDPIPQTTIINNYYPFWHYEYRSPVTLFGLPLVHVNLGRGLRVAKGVFAVGNIAAGCVALGGLSAGLLSLGGLSLGLLAIGGLAMGSVAMGMWSVGTVASASRVAIGVVASAPLAIGEEVSGSLTLLSNVPHSTAQLQAAISAYAHAPQWIEDFLLFLAQHIYP